MVTRLPLPKRGQSPQLWADVYCGQTVAHLSYWFWFISLLMYNFHGTQLFCASVAILFVIELATSMEDEDEG